MKRIMLLIGSLAILAAGTASAQTRVSVSLGFGAPRPYLAGTVFVGRPLVQPVYRPFLFRRFSRHRYFAPRCNRDRRFERRFRKHFDRD
jgi:hypothetical protein